MYINVGHVKPKALQWHIQVVSYRPYVFNHQIYHLNKFILRTGPPTYEENSFETSTEQGRTCDAGVRYLKWTWADREYSLEIEGKQIGTSFSFLCQMNFKV